jgi:hypothetical protein
VKLATIILYINRHDAGWRYGKDWKLVAHVHDEIQTLVRTGLRSDSPDHDEMGKAIVDSIRTAGETYKLRIPLDGEWKKGSSWAETH